MKRMMSPSACRHLPQHGLEPLLELAAVLGAGHQRAEVERHHALVLQRLRHVAPDDAERQALDDGGLADTRLADQHRVVLGAAGEHLDGAADLLVAADHRVELALAGRRGDVAGVLLQRVEALLGVLAVDRAALAEVGHRRLQPLRVGAGAAERPASRRFGGGERDQQPVLGDELVAGAGRLLLRRVEHAHDVRGELRLAGAAARDLGLAGELGFERLLGACRVAAGGADQARRGALLVVEQRLQQVLRRDALVVLADSDGLRGLEEPPRAVGELLYVHVSGVPSGKATPPGGPVRGNLPAGAAMRSRVLVGKPVPADASLSAPPGPVARAPRTR